MITITAPRGLESGLVTLIHKEMKECIEALADKYGFQAEEEITKLPQIKFVKKRGPIPKLDKQIKAETRKRQKIMKQTERLSDQEMMQVVAARAVKAAAKAAAAKAHP